MTSPHPLSLALVAVLGLLAPLGCVCELGTSPYDRSADAPVPAARPPAVAQAEPAQAERVAVAKPEPVAPREPAAAQPPTPAVPDATAASPQPIAPDEAFAVREREAAKPEGVTLQDAGAQPRRVLTLSATRGQRRTYTLSLGLEVAMRLGTRTLPPTAVPPLTVTLSTEVTEVRPEGITLSLAVDEVALPEGEATERVRGALEATARNLRQTAGSLTLRADGSIAKLALTGPAAPGEAGQALEPERGGLVAALQVLLPVLPHEAVGVGAKWRAIQTQQQGEVTLQQQAEFELRELADGRAVLAVTSSHVAVLPGGGDAEALDAKLDAATTMQVDARSGTAEATITLAEGAMPSEASAVVDSVTRAQVSISGTPQAVTMRTRVRSRLRAAATRGP